MIEILSESHSNILVIRGSGWLSRKDYEEVLIPRLEAMVHEHPKTRFLFLMDADFQGWDVEAALSYAKFGLAHRDSFEKVGAVCGPKWVHWGLQFKSLFLDADVKTFPCEQGADARQWIEA
jgi:hypothetical protein